MKTAGSALILLLACGFSSASGQDKYPTIVFDSLTKDFGAVAEGETLKHTFKFTNKGTATLEIVRAEPSCGCTATLLSAKKASPGESGQIEVALKTEGFSGKITKSVVVQSNDPRQPQLVLNVTAEIKPEFVMSERSIYFGNVPKGKEATREILITLPADKPLKLLKAESTDPNFTARLEPVAGSNGRSVKLIAVQKADAPEGFHVGSVVIKTTSPLTPELKIPVRGLVAANE